MQGKSAGDVFEAVIVAAKKAGILVMLDMHLLRNNTAISELWYDENFSEAEFIQAWQALLHRCATQDLHPVNLIPKTLEPELSSRPGRRCSSGAHTGAAPGTPTLKPMFLNCHAGLARTAPPAHAPSIAHHFLM